MLIKKSGIKKSLYPIRFKSNLDANWIVGGKFANASWIDLAALKTGAAQSVTWTGKKSGRVVKTFFNGGYSGEAAYLSDFPRIPKHRFMDPKDRDKYKGRRFDMSRPVSPMKNTLFAKVYDSWAKGGAAKIEKVSWLKPTPADSKCILVVVYFENGRTDFIYVSDDSKVRHAAGISFAGKTAIYSRINGMPGFGYVFGGGFINAGNFTLKGKKSIKGRLEKVYRKVISRDKFDAFLLNKKLPQSAVGNTLYVYNGDRSGNGYRITRVEDKGEKSLVYVGNTPAINLTKKGVQRAFFPRKAINGKPYFIYREPVFKAVDPAIKKISQYYKGIADLQKDVKITSNCDIEIVKKLFNKKVANLMVKKGPIDINIELPQAGKLKYLSLRCGYWRKTYDVKISASDDSKTWRKVYEGKHKGGGLFTVEPDSAKAAKFYKLELRSNTWASVDKTDWYFVPAAQ